MSATRILIVDDNPINMKLVTYVLQFEGYEVLKAKDAVEALNIIQNSPPLDLILMDIGLPGMDGLTLTKKLKAEGQAGNIPIVALTAAAMKGDAEKAFSAGCNGYITKPVDTRKFPAQIASYLAADRRPNKDPLS